MDSCELRAQSFHMAYRSLGGILQLSFKQTYLCRVERGILFHSVGVMWSWVCARPLGVLNTVQTLRDGDSHCLWQVVSITGWRGVNAPATSLATPCANGGNTVGSVLLGDFEESCCCCLHGRIKLARRKACSFFLNYLAKHWLLNSNSVSVDWFSLGAALLLQNLSLVYF